MPDKSIRNLFDSVAKGETSSSWKLREIANVAPRAIYCKLGNRF